MKSPLRWFGGRWHHEWSWRIQRIFFERRHYHRLLRIGGLLAGFTLAWCMCLAGSVVLFGGWFLVWQPAFVQNVLASLLILPLALAIGVVVGALTQKHALRFQSRHAG
jgi:hypothetical protein